MTHQACRLAVALIFLGALLPGLAAAQVAPPRNSPLARLSVSDPRFRVTSTADPLDQVASLVSAELRDGWTRFTAGTGGSWQAYVDRRTGWLEVAEGSGIPWIPGAGNTLTQAEIAASLPSGKVDLAALEGIARAFLPKVAPLLGVDPASLVLSPGRSGQPSGGLWLVDFDVLRGGRAIEGARVVFRVNNGNVVQFGSEGLPAAGAATPVQTVDQKQALHALSTFVGGFGAADTFLDGGSLHLLVANTSDPRFSEGFEPGNGRGLALVWEIVFRRARETGTWRGRVDAATGQVLDFRDVNDYAKVNGGVYTDTYLNSTETVLPMPFADVSPLGNANSAGIYNYTGGAVASTLDGLYVQIFDTCGAISQSANGSGRISFGTSSGTDCATPGTGGAGNTHSARTQFYHLNRIREAGRGWLPGNTWLNGVLPANVNLDETCNAYWDGNAVNFFKSGGGCGNTGEIAGVSLHEYGHGLDQNDGNGESPDAGTSESYGDVTSALTRHLSCQGNGFFSSNCDGYGDACTSCSGVRDIDWAKHTSNAPHTVDNFTRVFCPFGTGYDGPCGGEGHCESYVISEAVWDLAARDLANPGSAGAWSTTERLWYLTRSTTGSAFTCHNVATPWTSDGCAAGSLWRTFRAADDDDGNLANGTPHSCKLFAAFNRHGLACATDPGANVCFAACTPPAAPSLALTPGDGQVQLAWSSPASGVVYDVYRSDLGCSAGFVRIASGQTGTGFTDTALVNGLTYSYQLIAHPGSNGACSAAPTACQSATPQGPPCTPPAPATGLVAQATGLGSIRLTWDPLTAPGVTDVNILRSTTAGGPYTQVASVPSTASAWTDTGLAENTRYWYVIQAVADECASTNSNEASATTPMCAPLTLYSNDFETGSGLAGWTVQSVFGSSADWRGIQSCAAHSGSKVFRFGGPACDQNYAANEELIAFPNGAAGIAVPAASARTRLSFWHRWDFGSDFSDYGWLTLSIDGSPLAYVPSSTIVGGTGYTDGFEFIGQQSTFVNTVIDLDAACAIALGSGGCAGHTIEIGFTTSSGIGQGTGWFLDDVTVTVCTAHGCTGAPVIGAATTPANNQVQVTWSNGTPPSSLFNVYRTLGTCAASGPAEKIGSAVAGSPFLDTNASGTVTFAYRVAGLDASGLCESDLSACVAAAPTGPCTLSPTFAGLTAATNPGLTSCTLNLSWAAGSSRCGGSVTYTVYRSTTPGFLPGPANAVATGLTGTAFSDPGPLTSGTLYYYVVRAVDSNGSNDGNLQYLSVAPTGPLTFQGTLTDTFEGTQSGGGFDLAGWTHTALTGTQDWTWDNSNSQSPSHSWFAPQHGSAADQVLVSPPFVPQAGTVLSFWHMFSFEYGYDGGTLEISTDHGATWSVVPDSAFTMGGYTDTLYSGTGDPIAGDRAWTGYGPTWSQVKVDLSSWAGSDVQVRWHAGEDPSVGFVGWYVDSVTLSNVETRSSCLSTPPVPLSFYTVTPCRLADTRNANGPLGGPALQPGAVRPFTLTGVCGIPVTAKALSLNVTVTQPSAPGFLVLYPGGQLKPQTSAINFSMGQTRANNAVLPVDGTGVLQVFAANGPVHLILDVNGYFQ